MPVATVGGGDPAAGRRDLPPRGTAFAREPWTQPAPVARCGPGRLLHRCPEGGRPAERHPQLAHRPQPALVADRVMRAGRTLTSPVPGEGCGGPGRDDVQAMHVHRPGDGAAAWRLVPGAATAAARQLVLPVPPDPHGAAAPGWWLQQPEPGLHGHGSSEGCAAHPAGRRAEHRGVAAVLARGEAAGRRRLRGWPQGGRDDGPRLRRPSRAVPHPGTGQRPAGAADSRRHRRAVPRPRDRSAQQGVTVAVCCIGPPHLRDAAQRAERRRQAAEAREQPRAAGPPRVRYAAQGAGGPPNASRCGSGPVGGRRR